MRRVALLLILSFSAQLLAFDQCVLKLVVDSPQNWQSLTHDKDGDNVFVNLTIRNATGGNAVTDATVTVRRDVDALQSVFYRPAEGKYWMSFTEGDQNMHRLNITAEKSGCIPDQKVVYYYYNENAMKGMPDFDVVLLPAIALLSVLSLRIRRKSLARAR